MQLTITKTEVDLNLFLSVLTVFTSHNNCTCHHLMGKKLTLLKYTTLLCIYSLFKKIGTISLQPKLHNFLRERENLCIARASFHPVVARASFHPVWQKSGGLISLCNDKICLAFRLKIFFMLWCNLFICCNPVFFYPQLKLFFKLSLCSMFGHRKIQFMFNQYYEVIRQELDYAGNQGL